MSVTLADQIAYGHVRRAWLTDPRDWSEHSSWRPVGEEQAPGDENCGQVGHLQITSPFRLVLRCWTLIVKGRGRLLRWTAKRCRTAEASLRRMV